MRYATNYDGASTALPVALSVKNELQTVPFAGTDHDEMSFDYLKTIPAYYTTVNWQTTDLKEALLGSFDVGGNMSVDHNYGGATATTFLPCTVPWVCYAMYRGSVTLTIKAVKTEFHSGRIMLSFAPNAGYTAGAGTLNIDNTSYLHRAVIDVRQGNQWVFNIPYCSGTQWRTDGDTNLAYGTVYFHVIDPLVGPPTVSTSINLLVEVSGGEDLEYAFPTGTTYGPASVATLQSGTMDSCLKYVDTLGAATVSTESMAPTALCIGEKATSFRQLLKRAMFVPRTVNTFPAAYVTVVPYVNEVSYIAAGSVTVSSAAMDVYSLCASMYGFVRGSIRTALVATNDPDNSHKGCLTYVQTLPGGTTYTRLFNISTSDNYSTAGPNRLNGNLMAINENDSNLVYSNVQTPGYMSNGAIACADLLTTFVASAPVTYPVANSTAPRYVVNSTFIPTSGATNNDMPNLLRSGADDMSFGMFISTVPMYLIGGSVINNWTA
jgi:hypothetical protein